MSVMDKDDKKAQEILEAARELVSESRLSSAEKREFLSFLKNIQIYHVAYVFALVSDRPVSEYAKLLTDLLSFGMSTDNTGRKQSKGAAAKKKVAALEVLLGDEDSLIQPEIRDELKSLKRYYSYLSSRIGRPSRPSQYQIVLCVDGWLHDYDCFDHSIACYILRAVLPDTGKERSVEEEPWSDDTVDKIRRKLKNDERETIRLINTPI